MEAALSQRSETAARIAGGLTAAAVAIGSAGLLPPYLRGGPSLAAETPNLIFHAVPLVVLAISAVLLVAGRPEGAPLSLGVTALLLPYVLQDATNVAGPAAPAAGFVCFEATWVLAVIGAVASLHRGERRSLGRVTIATAAIAGALYAVGTALPQYRTAYGAPVGGSLTWVSSPSPFASLSWAAMWSAIGVVLIVALPAVAAWLGGPWRALAAGAVTVAAGEMAGAIVYVARPPSVQSLPSGRAFVDVAPNVGYAIHLVALIALVAVVVSMFMRSAEREGAAPAGAAPSVAAPR